MEEFFKLLLDYSIAILPAFLFALLISAVLAEVIPDSLFEKLLSSKGPLLVFLASIVGALIPLCTCGMIPLANKLQKKGTSWLIVISFLTAGNASSITALFMTLVLGFKITLLRFVFSVMFGILVAYIFVLFFKPVEAFCGKPLQHEEPHKNSISQKIIREFLGLLFCFGPWVIVAIITGSIISLYASPEYIIRFAGVENTASPFLLSVAGFPFYLCAGADIPISKALLEKGASLGGILVFMTASPGINLTSFFIYQRWLGFKNAFIYLTISAIICGLIGVLVNFLLTWAL